MKYPKLVSFEHRRDAFNLLASKVAACLPDHRLYISDVRYDRYGIYKIGCKKASVLIDGSDLASFDPKREIIKQGCEL